MQEEIKQNYWVGPREETRFLDKRDYGNFSLLTRNFNIF